MTALARVDPATGEITRFDPSVSRQRQDGLDSAIELAARIGDWEKLTQAAAAKVAEQAAFVAWWDSNISIRESNRKAIASMQSLSAELAQKKTGIGPPQVSRWRKRLKNAEAYIQQLVDAARKKALDVEHNHRAQGTGENEWYTPAQYIEAARDFLGSIDLDPASSDAAQKIVRAGDYFTAKDDGLRQEWRGRVWMNPPYSQPLIGQFVEKLAAEHEAGNVPEAVALMHNYTDTAWFHSAASSSAAICFTRGRIAFESPDGTRAAPTQGQAFFYLGKRPAEFAAAFSRFGFVVGRL